MSNIDAHKEKAIIEIKELARQSGIEISNECAEDILEQYVSSIEKEVIEGVGCIKPTGFLSSTGK